MNHLFSLFLLAGMLLTSCAEKTGAEAPLSSNVVDTPPAIPDTTVHNSVLSYNNKTSLWKLNDQLYSGHAVKFYQDSMLKEKIGILNGRKQNQAIQWYPDGHLRQVANYHKGKLHGERKKWSSDTAHVMVAQLNYRSGKAHGAQKAWYPTGELFKKLNMKMGREEGIQQAFRQNGALFANYEARDGRIYGLKKAALCYGLVDEDVVYEE